MVSAADESEIPFELEYGTIDPPTTVQFVFPNPAENVTMTLVELRQGAAEPDLPERGLAAGSSRGGRRRRSHHARCT